MKKMLEIFLTKNSHRFNEKCNMALLNCYKLTKYNPRKKKLKGTKKNELKKI